jgi:hypothetical protein
LAPIQYADNLALPFTLFRNDLGPLARHELAPVRYVPSYATRRCRRSMLTLC